jgi:hypothetical protein
VNRDNNLRRVAVYRDQHRRAQRHRALEFHMTATYISAKWVAHPAEIIVDASNRDIKTLIQGRPCNARGLALRGEQPELSFNEPN